jgi:hypothetical protein
MKAIVIKTKNKNEEKFLSDLLEKLGVSSGIISEEELEDLGFSRMMNNVDRNKKVSKETIMKKLKS